MQSSQAVEAKCNCLIWFAQNFEWLDLVKWKLAVWQWQDYKQTTVISVSDLHQVLFTILPTYYCLGFQSIRKGFRKFRILIWLICCIEIGQSFLPGCCHVPHNPTLATGRLYISFPTGPCKNGSARKQLDWTFRPFEPIWTKHFGFVRTIHYNLTIYNLQSTMTMWQVNDKTPLTQWQCVQKFQKARRSGGAKSNWQAERWPAQAQDETNNGLGIHEAVGSSPSATSTDKDIRIETHRSNNITDYHYHWLSLVNAVTVTVSTVNVNFFCNSLVTSPRPPTNDCYTCYADAMLSSHANSRPPCPLVEGKPRVWILVNVQHRQDPWTFHPQRQQIRWETKLDDCAIRNCRLIF